MNNTTIRQATERWVEGFNQYPLDMVEKLMKVDVDSWHEITKPIVGDYVWSNDYQDEYKVIAIDTEEEVATLEVEDEQVTVGLDSIYLEQDSFLPAWSTMWTFGSSCDDYWLEELGGLQLMSDCGFRIYEHDEWGYFFGIDGCGYDFYEAHWLPLYKARGLKWHDIED